MNVKSKLLENLAARIAVAVKGISASIDKVTVTVSKLNPPVGGKMEAFHVISSR
jgi:dihydroneopterin aldolase